MKKKEMNLGEAMSATVNKVPSVDAIFEAPTATAKEVQTQPSTGSKRGRPAATTAPDEVNVTFRLSKSLIQDIRVKAVMEQTTQKEIVDTALRQYLNK